MKEKCSIKTYFLSSPVLQEKGHQVCNSCLQHPTVIASEPREECD